jgi:hypothetical protein
MRTKEESLKERELGAKISRLLWLAGAAFDEFRSVVSEACATKTPHPEGGLVMVTTHNKRGTLDLHRPAQYPLPKGLLVGVSG